MEIVTIKIKLNSGWYNGAEKIPLEGLFPYPKPHETGSSPHNSRREILLSNSLRVIWVSREYHHLPLSLRVSLSPNKRGQTKAGKKK
jgi:hypothetical protein